MYLREGRLNLIWVVVIIMVIIVFVSPLPPPPDSLQDHIAIVAQAGVADDAVRVYVFAMMKTKGGHMLENLPPGNLKTLIYRMVALRSLAPQQYHPN